MSPKIKRIFALVLAVVLLCFNSQLVYAVTDETVLYDFQYPVYPGEFNFQYPELKDSAGPNVEAIEAVVDIDIFRNHLIKNFAGCPSYVNITDFKIPNTAANQTAIRSYIWYETPELFQINGLGLSASGGFITAVYASYYYTAEQYKTMYAEFLEGANRLLEGIKDNTNLSDVDKALLLHDRIAVHCQYTTGTTPRESYNAYGVFAKQDAVCMGYALAYDYLLREVGIDSYYCSSKILNHAWNIVYIDGIKYHVDVTWDDPIYDRSGRVTHTNFLRSTNGLIATGHTSASGIDYDTTPTDTTYDNYYWQDSKTAFQLVGDDIYYIDNTAKTLNKISNGVTSTCKSVDSRWWASSNSYWTGHYSTLSYDGKNLLYSLSEAIYKYDVETGASTVLFEPDLSVGAYYYIYGFKYENCNLICEIYSTPNFTITTKAENTVTNEHHISSDYWVTDAGSSATAEGTKHRECIYCASPTETGVLPKVSICVKSIATADYSECVLFTNAFICNEITDLITASDTTSISAAPSHNTALNRLYGTGSSISIYNGEEYIYDLTVIVNGDLNGDSVCDVLDVAQAEKYSNKIAIPTKNEIYAANGAVSDTIDAASYQRVVNTALSL